MATKKERDAATQKNRIKVLARVAAFRERKTSIRDQVKRKHAKLTAAAAGGANG